MWALAEDSSDPVSSELQKERRQGAPAWALCSQQLVFTDWEPTLNNFIACARSPLFTMCALPIFMETRASFWRLLPVWAAGEGQLGPEALCVHISIWRAFQEAWVFGDLMLYSQMAVALPLSFLARKSKSLGNELCKPGSYSLGILGARRMGKDWTVSSWGFRLRGDKRENGAGQDVRGCVCWQGDWSLLTIFPRSPWLCTWLHRTHMPPLIDGCNSISTKGNAGLQQIRERHRLPKKIFTKIFSVSVINVNYTVRTQRLINSCTEGEGRLNPVSSILKTIILTKANHPWKTWKISHMKNLEIQWKLFIGSKSLVC